ncbi:MAG: hypothetical protein LAT82_02450 [Nanoarchaeota archaeon]|nr:hypothetical protein [Nanoarchaeota archaeon]
MKTEDTKKSKDKSNTKIPLISVVLLVVLILISIVLLSLPSIIGIDKQYSLLINPNITLQELNNSNSRVDILELSLTNSNSILPNRVELDDIVLCIFNSNNQQIILSQSLDTSSYRIDRGSDIFNLRSKFIDIPSDSTINVIYSTYFYSYNRELSNVIKEIEELNYEYTIEFRAIKNTQYRYNFEESVCRGEEKFEIISFN